MPLKAYYHITQPELCCHRDRIVLLWGACLLEKPWLLASAGASTGLSLLAEHYCIGRLRLSGSHKDRLMLKRTLQSTGEGVLKSSSSSSSPEDASAAFRVCWSADTWTHT